MQKKQLELLAPAGSLESFFAAFENGADAVFCGLKTFSARAKAKNFTMFELERLVGYSHKLNKKIYVALNTLIKESELPELITVLGALEHLSIDGLIIQDLGLYHLAHIHFPEIPLHASTQMVVHNLAGVRVLEKLGFERAVLARELSLKEISYIGANCNLELEHFIHGALCYSMSGHCLFSSYIDGRSGNRGRCIQPCRRRYHHNENSGFYFSTSDFSALEHIPALSQAGVVSLKIEGRMKSAEYVASVVSAYRTVIDAKKGSEKEAIAVAKTKLESAMGRKSSDGFLKGFGGADIVFAKRKGGIGKIIGKVERLQGRTVSFKVSTFIHVGDRLRIQPGNDRAGQGFTVRKMFLGKRAVKRAAKNSFVSIPLPVKGKVHTGDLVFKLATGKAFTMSEEACLRRLNAAPVHSDDVRLLVDCNEKASSITISASVAGIKGENTYHAEMIPADRTPLNLETLRKVFSHTGYPELNLKDLQVGELPPVVIKPSRLKKIRRDFYTYFKELVERELGEQAKLKLQKVHDEVVLPADVGKTVETDTLYLVTDHLPDFQVVQEYPGLQFIFPVTDTFLTEVHLHTFEGHDRHRIIWDLPSILFDHDWVGMSSMIEKLCEAGFTSFRLNNISHFELFNFSADIQLIAGSWLHTLNSQSVAMMRRLGCNKYCLSIEDEKENIRLLLKKERQKEIVVTVYGAIDLFTSRIPAPVNEKEIILQNDKGEQLYLKQSEELTITRAGKPYSLLGKLRELREIGCRNFVLDMRGIGLGTSAGQRVVNAFYKDEILPGTVELNFTRGLS